MPETKLISTATTLSIVGSSITITTSYSGLDAGGGVLDAFVSEVIGGTTVDGVFFREGEGGITLSDSITPSELNFSVNSNGELLVFSSGDPTEYSVDQSTGNLIYTTS